MGLDDIMRTGFYSKIISIGHLPAGFLEPPLCKVTHFTNHSLLPVVMNQPLRIGTDGGHL